MKTFAASSISADKERDPARQKIAADCDSAGQRSLLVLDPPGIICVLAGDGIFHGKLHDGRKGEKDGRPKVRAAAEALPSAKPSSASARRHLPCGHAFTANGVRHQDGDWSSSAAVSRPHGGDRRGSASSTSKRSAMPGQSGKRTDSLPQVPGNTAARERVGWRAMTADLDARTINEISAGDRGAQGRRY